MKTRCTTSFGKTKGMKKKPGLYVHFFGDMHAVHTLCCNFPEPGLFFTDSFEAALRQLGQTLENLQFFTVFSPAERDNLRWPGNSLMAAGSLCRFLANNVWHQDVWIWGLLTVKAHCRCVAEKQHTCRLFVFVHTSQKGYSKASGTLKSQPRVCDTFILASLRGK